MQSKRFYIGLIWILAIFTVILFGSSTWAVTQEKVLHSFGSGVDGAAPQAALTFDAAGNLYGTTWMGGAYGHGTVFELTPQAGGGWTEQVLHSFGNGTDGVGPEFSLILDKNGNLYGTTSGGGAYGYGTVFELTRSPHAAGGGWTEKVLHSFAFGTDGAEPSDGLTFDAAGNLYGTTSMGGAYDYGMLFELTPTGEGWTEQVLHNFNNDGADGAYPDASLIFDAAGNLYGTTLMGGTYYNCQPGTPVGCGTVFELTPQADGSWVEHVLHSFGYGGDGALPTVGLVFDAAGNLYGTTEKGGPGNNGTVFELTRSPHAAGGSWTEKVLHSFGDGTDGAHPQTGLTFDAAGNLYGTTSMGGAYGYGTMFELTPTGEGWTEQVLHNFNNDGADGVFPEASLIIDAAGNLYGTTVNGGTYGYPGGTAFEIIP